MLYYVVLTETIGKLDIYIYIDFVLFAIVNIGILVSKEHLGLTLPMA